MEKTFTFEVGIGPHLWQRDVVSVEVEIPQELHDSVAESIGTDKMARLEFGFNFEQIASERFPALDALIHRAMEEQAADALQEWAEVYYCLQSPWFEE